MSTAIPLVQINANGNGRVPPAAPAHALHPDAMYDSHGRVIRDLRLSVTDRCNFRCIYCMDPDFRYMPKQQLLTLDEFVTVARACASLGLHKLRITGGEPTLYPQINELIKAVGGLPFRDIALTSNGSLFHQMPLHQWRLHGLHRITLSLDSLRSDRVAAITRRKTTTDSVINAIRLAKSAGFDPIKVNAVIIRGINDDEVADFADFARQHGVDYRLIEFMPLDSEHAWARQKVCSADEMLDRITARHHLAPISDDDPHSTSLNFTFADGSPGSIGIIASVTRPFCGACSRLRVTADGKVRPCLFSHDEWDLRTLLRAGATDQHITRFLIDSMWTKQAGHGINSRDFQQPERTMSAIGG